jgi:hypothetical protein
MVDGHIIVDGVGIGNILDGPILLCLVSVLKYYIIIPHTTLAHSINIINKIS